MASISPARGGWRVQIRRAGIRPMSRYFRTRDEAERWARSIEHAADLGKRVGGQGQAIDALLRAYRQARQDSGHAIGPTANAHYVLRTLEEHFAAVPIGKLTPQALVKFAQARRRVGAGAYTVNMDITQLASALRYACALEGYPYPAQAFAEARQTLHHLRLIGPSVERDRRPTSAEWRSLMDYLPKLDTEIPMRDIVEFAALAAFRRSEVCRLAWSDLDERRSVIVIRDRKHPRAKHGNDMEVPLVAQALAIVRLQPRSTELIFPYAPGTISYWFRRACRELGIRDLRLHDMRHEATSTMLESGFSVAETAAVTGHKDWRHLRRYTQLDPALIATKRLKPRR